VRAGARLSVLTKITIAAAGTQWPIRRPSRRIPRSRAPGCPTGVTPLTDCDTADTATYTIGQCRECQNQPIAR
jgi:hypothetical protein